jgi:ADP-ribosylation factor protein 1
MLGLSNGGKTSILYKLKLGEVLMTIPTIGFNVETVSNPIAKFTIWDVGGDVRIRALWRHYFVGRDLIIFVIDGSDEEQFDVSR